MIDRSVYPEKWLDLKAPEDGHRAEDCGDSLLVYGLPHRSMYFERIAAQHNAIDVGRVPQILADMIREVGLHILGPPLFEQWTFRVVFGQRELEMIDDPAHAGGLLGGAKNKHGLIG